MRGKRKRRKRKKKEGEKRRKAEIRSDDYAAAHDLIS